MYGLLSGMIANDFEWDWRSHFLF